MKLESKHKYLGGYLFTGCEIMYMHHSETSEGWHKGHLTPRMLDLAFTSGYLIKPILKTELSEEELEYVFDTKDEEATLRMWLDNMHAVFMKFDNCQLIFDRLYELHYDLHNLVQQGLAIKKEEL